MQEDSQHLRPEVRRGRGAATNTVGRYEPHLRERVDDGWWQSPESQIRTEVTEDRTRTILARNTSPDIPFDRSINPYRGCEHGCVYCFARPTHAFLGLSPGLDFETRIMAKPRAADLLKAALAKPRYAVAPIAMGTNTDPYQPVETTHRITRAVLEVLHAHNHPVTIVTKGALIRRDLDILSPMAARGLAHVGISLTTLDRKLSRDMEPRAAAPEQRLRVIAALARAGVPVRAMIAPVIPGLTDHELEALVQAAANAGAQAASLIVLRLPLEVSPLFRDWLTRVKPASAAKVMARVRELHGGKDYDPTWSQRMRGQGIWANLIQRRFEIALKKNRLSKDMAPLRCDLFQVPGQQMELF